MEITFKSVTADKANGYAHSHLNLMRYLKEYGYELKKDDQLRDWGMVYTVPANYKHLNSTNKICFTMFETDHLPDSWVDWLNKFDLVLTPTAWGKAVFRSCGVKSKVCNLGIEHDLFKPVMRREKEKFVFIHYDCGGWRKGFDIMLNAFKKAFKKDEPVELWMKTVYDKNLFPLTEYPNAKWIKGIYDRSKLPQLLYKADCFVFPTRGEGFGHTPLEAMATGLPCIVPNATGISEYFNPKYFYDIKTHTQRAKYDFIKEETGYFREPDVDDLAEKMRHVYNNKVEAYRRGFLGAGWVLRYWTYKRTAFQFNKIFSNYVGNKSQREAG